MKKLLLGTVGLVALSGSAIAADLAPHYKAPPPVVAAPIYDWTGFYIGANGGWGDSRNCWGIVPLAGATIADGCASRSGGVFGGQFGYRWQAGQFVFGVEGQGDWANLSGSNVSAFNPLFTTGVKVDSFGLITGQIGYAWNASLFYLKGGAATTRNRLDIWSTASGVNVATASSNRWGGSRGRRLGVWLCAELVGGHRIRPPLHGRREQLVLGGQSAAGRRGQSGQSRRRPAHASGELPLRRTNPRLREILNLCWTEFEGAGQKAGFSAAFQIYRWSIVDVNRAQNAARRSFNARSGARGADNGLSGGFDVDQGTA